VLPKARARKLGVIVKRPIANAAWIGRRPHADWYSRPYYDRLQVLDYDFLGRKDSVATALRFTLSAPGVHCAIVGTTRAGRFEDNARIAALGRLPRKEYKAIRARWRAIAKPDWTGER
jgi:aryl-alcohol dehydrogenase-like predicted oxidoreductase